MFVKYRLFVLAGVMAALVVWAPAVEAAREAKTHQQLEQTAKRSARAKISHTHGKGFTTEFASAKDTLGSDWAIFQSINRTTGELLKGKLNLRTRQLEVTERTRPLLTNHGMLSLIGKHMKRQHGGRMGPIKLQPPGRPTPGTSPKHEYIWSTRDPSGKPVKGWIDPHRGTRPRSRMMQAFRGELPATRAPRMPRARVPQKKR